MTRHLFVKCLRIFLISLFLFISYYGFTQSIIDNPSQTIPLDTSIHTGKLKNGLKYTIRKNTTPKKFVELRLAVNIGSLQEDNNQLGIAHFVEHMAFNGTKNFKKNELVNYLQSIGVKFGAHVNAYTSFDETVYMLTLPSDDDEVLKKGFQVLRDWAGNLSFDKTEIDKERGVVIEEWRLGLGANERMQQKYFPVLLKDSRYAKRLPIGKKEIIEKASYSTIKKFYNDWYRPELMSVVVVGDIDIVKTEKTIKELFTGLKKSSKKARKREIYSVPDHKETLISIVSDKEYPYSVVQVLYKKNTEIYNTVDKFKKLFIYQLYTGMLNLRLAEYLNKPSPPFLYANIDFENHLVRSKAGLVGVAVVTDGQIEQGLKILLEENKRILTHGFTQTEFDRFKKEILNYYKNAYNERDKTESTVYASEYIRVFLQQESSPGIEYEYEFCKQYLDKITLEEVSNLAKTWLTTQNRVILALSPEKEGLKLPTEEGIRAVIQEVENHELNAYEDNINTKELIPDPIVKGTVIDSQKIEAINVSQWTLSNGAKVVFKPTDFKNDEIVMEAYSLGGHSLYEDKDYFSALHSSSIANLSGVGDFSLPELQKLLTGKRLTLDPFIDSYTEGFRGNTSAEDLEIMFQLIHLYFSKSRKSKEAVESYKNRTKGFIQNLKASPTTLYFDQVEYIMNQNHLRGNYIPTFENIDKIDENRVFEIFKERFANIADFTFFFVGNIDQEKLKHLTEKYLGSLIGQADSLETWKDRNIRAPKGVNKKTIYKGKAPKSYVNIFFTGEGQYDKEDEYLLKSLSYVLDIKFINKLREEQSGVYGIGITSEINVLPNTNYQIRITFPCAPENVDKLIESAFKEIKNIKINGVSQEDLQKVKESQRLEYQSALEENSFWIETLFNSYLYKKDPIKILDFEKNINNISSEALQKIANKYFNFDNYTQIVLKPEKK